MKDIKEKTIESLKQADWKEPNEQLVVYRYTYTILIIKY